MPQSVILEQTTRIPETLAKQGILGQIKEKQKHDKSTFHLPRQGERTTECVGKSAAELGIVRQS